MLTEYFELEYLAINYRTRLFGVLPWIDMQANSSTQCM